jgi:ATP-binding cassette subfamily B multidrug efflux pump
MSGGKLKKEDKNVILKKVRAFLGRYRLLLVLSIAFSGITAFLTLYIPVLFGNMIDDAAGKGKVDFKGIASYSVQILIFIIVTALMTWIMNAINNRLAYRTVRDIRSRAIRQIVKLPLSYLDSHSTGDIVSRVIADADQFSDGLLLGLTQLFSGLMTIIFTLVFMLMKSIPITLIIVVMTPVTFVIARFIATRSYKKFRDQSIIRGEQTSLVNEMISGEDVVRAFGYEKISSDRFREINLRLQDCSEKALFFSSLTNPSTRAVNSVIYAFVALIGAFMILGGHLTVGGLTVLLTYANQYMKPFNDISSVITELQNALACAGRIFEIIETPAETETGRLEPAETKGVVAIKDVAFSYDKSSKLIEDFNLDVKSGMRVAIVGPTGCGKTTFINLLMRFYDVDRGSISIDGVNLMEMTRHALRRKFGMVLQDTWLMHSTVRENIAFGKPDATDEEIIAAAKEAKSYSFIKKMPEGLDTIIEEDDLSQGEKQLLCITRVMLIHPDILILDEATSSIDTRTEMLIQSAFDKLMKGHTSFIVAHRLKTIINADVIVVMKDGRIIETGNHEELMKKGGFYYDLYNAQFDGIQR